MHNAVGSKSDLYFDFCGRVVSSNPGCATYCHSDIYLPLVIQETQLSVTAESMNTW